MAAVVFVPLVMALNADDPPPPEPQSDPVPEIRPELLACRHCVTPVMAESVMDVVRMAAKDCVADHVLVPFSSGIVAPATPTLVVAAVPKRTPPVLRQVMFGCENEQSPPNAKPLNAPELLY
jgi:hypothetical protein